MTEIDSSSPISDQHPVLGPELFRCRLLSGAKTLQSQGYHFAWFMYYGLYPLLMLPYLALMVSMGVFIILGYRIEEMFIPTFWVVFWCLYVGLGWAFMIQPLADHLVLHEKGVRIGLWFQRLVVPFESINGIFLGREPSKVEEGLRKALGFLKPKEAAWLNAIDGTAVTVVTKNGKTHVFKTLLTRFEPKDLEKFFQEFLDRNPHLAVDGTVKHDAD